MLSAPLAGASYITGVAYISNWTPKVTKTAKSLYFVVTEAIMTPTPKPIIANSKIGNGDLNEKNLDVLQRKLIEIGRINQLSFSEIKKDRNASIVGGLTFLKALMQELKIPKIIPIKSGLRMGVLWNLHIQK